MTTAAPDRKAPSPEPIALELIVVRSNIRKTFNESKLKELAGSIKEQGLINPITVRAIPGGKYELVAGERRYRAAKLIGFGQISAIVRSLNDQEALELQTAENIHREDITPIEEARGFELLTKSGKYTVAQLAELVNKSKVYVHRSIKLLELPKAVIEAIDHGELSAAHGHQILRVPAGDRSSVSKWIKKDMTAVALGKLIDENAGRDLKRAAWDMGATFAGMPACAGCPSNSANQKDLFDAAAGGKCLNGGCFDKKQAEVDRLQAAELTKKYPEVKLVAPAAEYDIKARHKVTDIPPAIASQKKMQEAIKANPENYIVAMVKDTDWVNGKNVTKLIPQVFVKESAKKEVLKVIGKSHNEAYRFGGSHSSGSGGASRSSLTPKQRFIRRAGWKAWLEAAAKVDVTKSRAGLLKILEKLEPGHYETKIPLEIMGIVEKKTGWTHKLIYDKLTTAQLLTAVLLFALDTHELAAADFKALGIDTDKLKKVAAAKAETDWELARAAKK